jgi:hypothetical protein
MQLAAYVVYELVIRLQQIDPAVGEYLKYNKVNGGIRVHTTTGFFEIPDTILDLQFHNPDKISAAALKSILESFT